MQLLVVGSRGSGSERHVVNVAGTATGAQLKLKVSTLTGVPTNKLLIFFVGGAELKDEATLGEQVFISQ